MTNTGVMKISVDRETATLHIEREFAAPVARVWEAYTNHELLDQWWAPKPWKAVTSRQDFREGGEWLYAMVSPEGEKHYGLMRYHKIDPLQRFSGEDAFCDENGAVNEAFPTAAWTNSFEDLGNATRVTIVSKYETMDQLDQVIKMGMKEGLTMAMDTLDELLQTLDA